MRVRASSIGSVFGAGLLLLGGCAYGEVRQVVRAHFASEFDCPEVMLKKRELWYSYEGPDQFKAMGCGHVRTYTCPDKGMISYDDDVCTFVEGDADAPKPVAMTPEGEEEEVAPPDDMGGDEGTSGGEDTGGDSGDSGGSADDDDLGGGADSEAEDSGPSSSSGSAHGSASGSSSHGAATGSGKAGGKIKLGK